ncbi:hypothetical protein HNQ77_005338 [Silvibacterium bohemicum]|uniref:Uncharacterized protein n=1 Tax=Silvibacterium bohemicum TaxID=1577686 RepID=A0A841K180_9BACT|nr:hypothetical protein [Silvibacterium bohemicum]MBB6147342.1 hypothetical protein [Silvibacterium bohemicum]
MNYTSAAGTFDRPSARGATWLAFVAAFLMGGSSIGLNAQQIPELPDAPSFAVAPQSSSQFENSEDRAFNPRHNQGSSLPGTLNPLTPFGKFVFATKSNFNASALLFAAAGAGINQSQNLYPEFHQGAAGYARNYWHVFTDQTVDGYVASFLLPATLHQDPRYYPLNQGGVLKRTRYSLSRLFITRTDDGGTTFNTSEVLGSGMAASVSSLYYPRRELTFSIVSQRWITDISGDGLIMVLKEFSPDHGHALGNMLPGHRSRKNGSED